MAGSRMTILAFGGGEGVQLGPIRRELLGLVDRPKPRIVYLPTAGRDNPESIATFYKTFTRLGTEVEVLRTIGVVPSPAEIRKRIGWADIVFVGGGNTLMMMRRWKFLGVNRELLRAARRGTVLAGASAGSICWFESGHSDSMRGYGHDPWDYIQVSGFGLLRGFHCPHYHHKDRAERFQEMILRRGGHGIAMDDGAGIIVRGGRYRVISVARRCKVYSVRRCRGRVVETEIPKVADFRPLREMYEY